MKKGDFQVEWLLCYIYNIQLAHDVAAGVLDRVDSELQPASDTASMDVSQTPVTLMT